MVKKKPLSTIHTLSIHQLCTVGASTVLGTNHQEVFTDQSDAVFVPIQRNY